MDTDVNDLGNNLTVADSSGISLTDLLPKTNVVTFSPKIAIIPPIKVAISKQNYVIEDIQYGMNSTQRTILLIFIIILILLFIGIIISIFIRSYNTNHKSSTISNIAVINVDMLDSNLGGSYNGVTNIGNGTSLTYNTCNLPYGVWDGVKCDCVPPYYGHTCSLQSHDINYYSFGTPDDEQKVIYTSTPVPDINPHQNITWNSKGQLDSNSCSAIASNDASAIGFYYGPNGCSLIKDRVYINDTKITWDPNRQSTLFLKQGFGPTIYNKVFVSPEYSPILRYYVDRPNTSTFAAIPIDTITVVNFTPYSVINASELIGIWSPTPFEAKDFWTMITVPNRYFVDFGQDETYTIKVPVTYTHIQYYVMYTKKQP